MNDQSLPPATRAVWSGFLQSSSSVDELASFFRKAVDDYMVAESAVVLKTHSAL